LIEFVADPAAGSRRSRARARLDVLTDREREVAVALGRGWTNAKIGAGLRMGLPTVKGHVSHVLAKLDLNNRVQVAVLVHDAELL
jgi:DNA-binding NarL/FixJ family response regulator